MGDNFACKITMLKIRLHFSRVKLFHLIKCERSRKQTSRQAHEDADYLAHCFVNNALSLPISLLAEKEHEGRQKTAHYEFTCALF